MSKSYKPDRYSTVSPYLVVDGASATIDFLKQAFDAQELRRMLNEDGSVMHAEIRIDDSVIMLGDRQEGWGAMPAFVHIYVQDVDASYQKALDAGATSVKAPIQEDDEDKRGGVKDAGGTTWWIATTVGLPSNA